MGAALRPPASTSPSCSRRWTRASSRRLRDRGEPGRLLRPTSNTARALLRGLDMPRGSGHLHDPDRRDGRRGTARIGRLGRVEGTVTSSERRVQRVRGAVSPPGECRHDTRSSVDLADASRRRLGHAVAGRRCGTSCVPVAAARGHELRAARGRGWPPVALSRPRPPGFALPARMALGRRSRRSRPGARSAVVELRGSEGTAHRRVPVAPHHRAGARLATTPGCSPTPSHRRSATAKRSTSTRRRVALGLS